MALGGLHLDIGNQSEALAWIENALATAIQCNSLEIECRAHRLKGRYHAEVLSDRNAARESFAESIRIATIQSLQFRSPVTAAHYRSGRNSVIRELLHSAFRQGDCEKVLEFQEQLAGRFLVDIYSARIGGQELNDECLKCIRSIDQEIAQLSNRLRTTCDSALYEASRQIAKLESERESAIEQFLDQFSAFGRKQLPVSIDRVSRKLGEKSAFLSISEYGGETIGLIINRNKPPRVESAGDFGKFESTYQEWKHTIDEQLTDYQSGFELSGNRTADLVGLLKQFANGPLGRIIASAMDDCVEEIIVSLDNEFPDVPLHAFCYPQGYLVKRVNFVYQFSAAMFTRSPRRRRLSRNRAIAVAEHESVLPNARHECSDVMRHFFLGRVLDGKNLKSKDQFFKAISQARVLHVACHAECQAKSPMHSRICMPWGEHWYTGEMVHPSVAGLELAFLNACRSGVSNQTFGDELFSMSASLLAGGTRGVIASSWQIADKEVVPVVKTFYEKLPDMTTSRALSKAQALASHNLSPLFWAPFKYYGDHNLKIRMTNFLQWVKGILWY